MAVDPVARMTRCWKVSRTPVASHGEEHDRDAHADVRHRGRIDQPIHRVQGQEQGGTADEGGLAQSGQ